MLASSTWTAVVFLRLAAVLRVAVVVADFATIGVVNDGTVNTNANAAVSAIPHVVATVVAAAGAVAHCRLVLFIVYVLLLLPWLLMALPLLLVLLMLSLMLLLRSVSVPFLVALLAIDCIVHLLLCVCVAMQVAKTHKNLQGLMSTHFSIG